MQINQILLVTFLSLLVAQTGKLLWKYFRTHKWDPSLLWSASGMPSSHAAVVSSATVTLGLLDGFLSPIFGVAAVFSLLFMYDAMGVRRAVGDQAELLNYLMELRDPRSERALLERVGHTPLQVVIGAVVGCLIAFGMFYV